MLLHLVCLAPSFLPGAFRPAPRRSCVNMLATADPDRIAKLEATLIDLEGVGISKDVIANLKAELKELKQSVLEDEVASLGPETDDIYAGLFGSKRGATPTEPAAPPPAPPPPSPAPRPSVQSAKTTAMQAASSVLVEALRAIDFGQRQILSESELQPLRNAIQGAQSTANFPAKDLEMAKAIEAQAAAPLAAVAAAEAGARTEATQAIDEALRAIDYGQSMRLPPPHAEARTTLAPPAVHSLVLSLQSSLR